MTSAEAARALGVGVSSIKRWTDSGQLPSVRTPGGHRRYTVSALLAFAKSHNLPTSGLPSSESPAPRIGLARRMTLEQALLRGDMAAVDHMIRPPQGHVRDRAIFFDRVADGAYRGELTVDEEHRASHLLAEAIDKLRPFAEDIAQRKLALLACPPDELHELPLRLVRLILEWSGWRTDLIGAALPWDAALHAIERTRPSLICFSARSGIPFLQPEFQRFALRASRLKAKIVTGGPWARGGVQPATHLRFRTLRGFESWLNGVER